jgi:transposase
MKKELQNLSKSELIDRLLSMEKDLDKRSQSLENKLNQSVSHIKILSQKLEQTEEQLRLFKRLIFGAKRERYVSNASQMALPFAENEAQKNNAEREHAERIEYTRRKAAGRKHPGRDHLPEDLPIEEVHVDPPGDLSELVRIGELITNKLEIVPAKAYIKRYIRGKYVVKDNPDAGVLIAELPDEVADKSIAGPSVMAQVIVDKYADHLPLYRQQQRFSRHGMTIASSTLGSWVQTAGDRLNILYEHYVAHTKSQGYLQVDETPIPVLESDKPGKTHQGYYWVYYSPLTRSVLFDYQPGRGRDGPAGMLDTFSGYMQTDGYAVYDRYGQRPDVTHLGCWAHARRYFERALDTDWAQAENAMGLIQQLYAIERHARDGQLPAHERKNLRQEQSLPILDQLGEWISRVGPQTDPKNAFGKAMYYTAAHWDKLNVYVQDGSLEIDNNLVENQIRSTVVGRKNFLFAGSHKAAQRAAMFYTLIGNCKLHGVNPTQWLEHVLRNIMATKYNDVPSLYPQNFKSTM